MKLILQNYQPLEDAKRALEQKKREFAESDKRIEAWWKEWSAKNKQYYKMLSEIQALDTWLKNRKIDLEREEKEWEDLKNKELLRLEKSVRKAEKEAKQINDSKVVKINFKK